jgi:trimeric autotransporter adhesin
MRHHFFIAATAAMAVLTFSATSCKKELPDDPANPANPSNPTTPTTITGSSWVTVGNDIDGAGYGLKTFNDKLYVAGNFFEVGSSPSIGCAYYDGTSLNAINQSGVGGSGFSCFGVHNSQLFGGGAFSQFMGPTCCAVWDGTEWNNGTYSINSNVYAMESFGGNLYIGGYFTSYNSAILNRIAMHNGSGWVAMGMGFDNTVNALAVYNNELYAGGQFSNSGSNPVNKIAKWNGTSWEQVGTSGLNGTVRAMTVFNGELYVAGLFTQADGNPARYIARWNGTTWSDVGGSLTGGFNGARCLTTYGGELFVGGDFNGAGSVPVVNVARWTGTSWAGMGTGFTGIVSALEVYRGSLFALQSTYTGFNYLMKFQ